MKRIKIIFILSLFLFGTASLLLQAQTYITSWQQFLGLPQYGNYILTQDIVANSMYPHIFTGTFDGGGHKITVIITSNDPSVGLFREVRGGYIYNLIIVGEVIGGTNSQYVGALAGQMTGRCDNITNLADVTGTSANSCVGGVGGVLFSILGSSLLNNNGTITGGQYVAGIFGKVNAMFRHIAKYCGNAGTIRGNGINNSETQTYIAGIFAFVSNSYEEPSMMHNFVNIGQVLCREFDYSGGIVAYSENCEILGCSNAGIVDGALEYTGGIIGYLNSGIVNSCINTNWIGRTQYSGAIAGYNNGSIDSCYYDEQMSIVGGINYQNIPNQAEGRPTSLMIGTNLSTLIVSYGYGWTFEDNLYPRPVYASSSGNHPITLLSAAPIYLQNNERLDGVRTDFFVSNDNSLVPFPSPISRIQYPYQWGWYPNGVFSPFSMMQYISIPMPPSNTATIIGRGQDSIAVRYDHPNYENNGFYPEYTPNTGYTIVFEKIVPIWLRR
jgi:hypothetical protein